MLTKKELLSFNPEYGASSLKKRSQIKLYNSHLEALDEIERLKAEVAAKDKEVQHYMSSFANLALEHGRI